MLKSIIIFLLLSNFCYAQDKGVVIKQGEPAPFSGILLSPELQAKMIADSQYNKKACELENNYLSLRQKTTCDFEKNSLKVDLDTISKKYDLTVKLKDNEISRLNQSVVESNKKSDRWVWWLAGGVVSGIALTVAVTYAVNHP